jgi:hypothetical protein
VVSRRRIEGEKEQVKEDDRPRHERPVAQQALMAQPEHPRHDEANQKRDNLLVVGGPDR